MIRSGTWSIAACVATIIGTTINSSLGLISPCLPAARHTTTLCLPGRLLHLRAPSHRSLCVNSEVTLDGQPLDDALFDGNVPYHVVRRVFDDHLKNEAVPILADVETYCNMLPVRGQTRKDGGEFRSLHLCKLPYWAVDDSVRETAMKLEEIPSEEERYLVKYAVAPKGHGKTASMLPVFLESLKSQRNRHFTHYLYMAFRNNGGAEFQATNLQTAFSTFGEDRAENIGALLMLECVKRLITNNSGKMEYDPQFEVYCERDDESNEVTLPLSEAPPTVLKASRSLQYFINEKFGRNDVRILLHVDEHRHMSKSLLAQSPNKIEFRRGALGVLATTNSIVPIVTFTDRLSDAEPVDADDFSGICTSPVELPILDVSETMKMEPKLNLGFEFSDLSGLELKRLYSTLVFTLSYKLQYDLKLSSIQGLRGAQTKKFLNAFQDTVGRAQKSNSDNIDKAKAKILEDCIDLCKVNVRLCAEENKFSVELLLGIPDKDLPRTLSSTEYGQTFVSNGKLTRPLNKLMTICPEFGSGTLRSVYCQGAMHFFKRSLENKDNLSGSILEAAFVWTLSCRAALKGVINWSPEDRFNFLQDVSFKCTAIKSSRIFQDGPADHLLPDLNLEPGVLYYADEPGTGGASNCDHPRADIFFIDDNKERLVLIDIFGGTRGRTVSKKQNNMEKVIKANQDCGYEIFGVVLAPWVKKKSISIDVSCHDLPPGQNIGLYGKDAVDLLGGLSQMRYWLEYFSKAEEEKDNSLDDSRDGSAST